MLRSNKTARESVESALKKERLWCEGCAEKEGFSLEWKSKGVMDDENGESIDEEVPVIGRGEQESRR